MLRTKTLVFPAAIARCSDKMPAFLSGLAMYLSFFSSMWDLVINAACW